MATYYPREYFMSTNQLKARIQDRQNLLLVSTKLNEENKVLLQEDIILAEKELNRRSKVESNQATVDVIGPLFAASVIINIVLVVIVFRGLAS